MQWSFFLREWYDATVILGILNGIAQGGGGGEEGNGFVPREPLNQKSVREGDIQKNIGSLTLASSTLKALTANTDVLDILGSSNKQRKFS